MMQFPEVVALHNHIVEFKKGQALFPTLFEAFCSKHTVNGKVYTNLAQQLNIVQIQQPVGVIGDNGFVFTEVNKTAHLLFEAGDVVRDKFRREHLAHFVLAAGVTDHTSAAAQKYDGTMACALHMAHHHQGDKVTYMQTIGGGVEAYIKSDFFLL